MTSRALLRSDGDVQHDGSINTTGSAVLTSTHILDALHQREEKRTITNQE